MRRRWLIVAVIVLAGCGSDKTQQLAAELAASTTTTTAPTTSTTTTTRPTTTTAKRFVVGDKIVSTKSGSTDVLFSHQVFSYEQPVAPPDRFTNPAAGMEFGVADVEVCAGTEKVSYNPFAWNAQTPDNRRYRTTFQRLRNPTLSSGDIAPGAGCVRGWVTFELPVGQRPTSLVHDYFGSVVTHWFLTAA